MAATAAPVSDTATVELWGVIYLAFPSANRVETCYLPPPPFVYFSVATRGCKEMSSINN
jgi:hypothetical protein